jgi:outer membrane lipoprotein SlyB
MNIHHRTAYLGSYLVALLLCTTGMAFAQNTSGSTATSTSTSTSKLINSAKIQTFELEPVQRLSPGVELHFKLYGTPGGAGTVRIDGVPGKLILDEVESGLYEGTHNISNSHRVRANALMVANLRIGNSIATATLDQPILAMKGAMPVAQVQDHRENVVKSCANCGVIESIQIVEVKGNGSYVGKVAGGVVGAVLGSQVGRGKGTTAAEIAGAIGGAVAGNEIEKRTKSSRHFDVTARLTEGGVQTVTYPNQPPFIVGQKVKLENGVFVANGNQ